MRAGKKPVIVSFLLFELGSFICLRLELIIFRVDLLVFSFVCKVDRGVFY